MYAAPMETDLRHHLRASSLQKVGRYVCPFCEGTFAQASPDVLDHIALVHEGAPKSALAFEVVIAFDLCPALLVSLFQRMQLSVTDYV